jgi:hypothetical protein
MEPGFVSFGCSGFVVRRNVRGYGGGIPWRGGDGGAVNAGRPSDPSCDSVQRAVDAVMELGVR